MHVTFDYFRCAKDFATNGMVQNVRVQSLTQSRSLLEFEDAAIINDAGIAAL